jgi:hypothetical protein
VGPGLPARASPASGPPRPAGFPPGASSPAAVAAIVGGRLLEIHTLREAVDRQLRHYRRLLIDRLSIIGARRAMKGLETVRA